MPIMNPITLPSYAKINLFLDIVGVREDGYHLLTMVNAKIALHDSITCTIHPTRTIKISGSHSAVPFGRENTMYQAAELFLKQTHSRWGCSIFIEKHIPIGAGLGGGSSNAATVLQALNDVADPHLPHAQLVMIGAAVGADVPFFLHEGCCCVRGIGEQVMEFYVPRTVDHPLPSVVLCSPEEKVSTREAYALWDRMKRKAHASPTRLLNALMEGRLEELHGHLFNAFESVIYPAYPAIQKAYEDFKAVSPTVPLLSGSGSNIFSIVADAPQANETVQRLREKGYSASAWDLRV